MESLYKLRICESAQLKTVLELYDMKIHQKISMPNYQKKKRKVNRRKEQKHRLRNFDARHGRIETGAAVTSRRGSSGIERGKVFVTSGKQKGIVREETNAVSGMSVTIVRNAATLSEPTVARRRRVSRKRSIRGKSNHGAILRQPCTYNLKGTCTRSPCEYWHPPECQFYKKETGCQAGDQCLFPAS